MAPAVFTPFETTDKAIHSETQPLASGLIIDFAQFPEYDTEARQNSILTGLSKLGLTQRPCMILDLAPVDALNLLVDGKPYEPVAPPPKSGDDSEDEDTKKKLPPMARIVLTADSLVDLTNLRPVAGSSIIRANGAVPSYRWFQAANLLLHGKDEFGRVIPFPLEQENGDTTYQAMRVNPDEFRQYQGLLKHAVDQDGLEQGFFIAAKFAYQVLLDRGHSEISHKQVGKFVTDIAVMGDSSMKGVLILNSGGDDFEDISRLSLYF